MNDAPDGGLTPPGPQTESEAEQPRGGMSVDAWLEQARDRPAQPVARMAPDVPRYDSRRSRNMAGWALGLSLALCIPFAFLVAIGLAIAVLVRSAGGGEDHGKGKAIAALVISGLIIIANVVYAVVIVFNGVDGTERDADGQVVDGGTVTPDRLRVGDCFTEPAFDKISADGSEREASATIEVVPCSEPHQAEAFHSFKISGDDFPGHDAISSWSADCFRAFKEYVGKAYAQSSLDVMFYSPTAQSWRFGDRTILCSLTERDLSDMTDTARDSRR